VEMLNRRLRALVTAGLIALSGGAAATSVASEVDTQDEGVSTQPGATDDAVGGGTGPETQLPVEVDPVLPDPDQDVTTEAPGDVEPPATTPLEVVAPEAIGPDGGSSGGPGAESIPAPVEPPASPVPPAPAPGGDAGGSSAPVLLVEDQGVLPDPQRLHADTGDQVREPTSAVDALPPGDVTVQTQPATESTLAPEAQSTESPPVDGPFHIVQAGESLWSIAADLLGPGASTAAVARGVHRLWELNKGRIGTSDPNLLPTGVKLRLR
jgi:hypothetical protein